MSIVQITEQEQRLTNTLRMTTEALKQVTAERDAQRKVLEQALKALETCRIRSVSEWEAREVTPKIIMEAITAIQGVLNV